MKLMSKIVPIVAVLAFMSACGSSGSSSGTAAAAGTGETSVESISSLPSADLSNYDSSASASASIAQQSLSKSVSKSLSKSFGEGMQDVGDSSRAGCEANMHKQEVFRMSQEVQLDRCYPKAMEKAGLITIPTGSYAYYRISPPEQSAEDKVKMCDDIPAEMDDQKKACEAGGEGPGGGNMLMRIGIISSELRVDMCQGAAGLENLVSEAGYSASGTVYTADMTRIGDWGGSEEKSKFHMVVDIGATGKVVDEIATIGDDGFANAAGQISGGFGSGNISFEKVDATSNLIKGAFAGGFTDPFSGTATSFTGKTYAKFNATAGCAKFSFAGAMPGMKVSDMIPFNISDADKEGFLKTFGAQLGISLTLTNYTSAQMVLCPNELFDPANPDPAIKPMLLAPAPVAPATTSVCPLVTDVGVECFSITNGTTAGDFGEDVITQTFTKVANSASSFFDSVNAFVIDSLSATVDIAFSRNWDCSGTFTTLDFASVTPAQMAAAQTVILSCQALEEKAKGNQGMGGYSCGKEEQMNGVDDFAKDGGGGAATFGAFGGHLNRSSNGTCPEGAAPQDLFVNVVNADLKQYCIPNGQGACDDFTVNEANLAAVGMAWDSSTLTSIQYNSATPTSADVVWTVGMPCTATYNLEKPDFSKPPEFGATGDGDAPGEAGFVPQPCIDAGLTGPANAQACKQLCQKPGTDCTP